MSGSCKTVDIRFDWVSLTVDHQVPKPLELKVDFDEECIPNLFFDPPGPRLVFDNFWGACVRQSIASELRGRGVPDGIAAAMSASVAPDDWNGTDTFVAIALCSTYREAD